MKNWKSIFITLCSFVAISSMVLLNSCVKDPCTELSCRNGGTCSEGLCQCPTGYEGAECEITAASRFVGKWAGTFRANNQPISNDTVTITLFKAPNIIQVQTGQGNTAVLGFLGEAKTPETDFPTFVTNGVQLHAYIRVDGGLMQFYLQSVTPSQPNKTQNSYFSGIRISNN